MMSQLPLDLGHRTALGGADFHVAASNREAVAWLDRWPDWPAGGLAVHGPPGSGKTHLAHVWADRAAARLIGPADLAGLDPHRVSAAGPVAIDALGDAPLDAEAERRLLHLYNALVASGRTLLLLGRRPPARWPLSLADLRSRLVALPAVAMIFAPCAFPIWMADIPTPLAPAWTSSHSPDCSAARVVRAK